MNVDAKLVREALGILHPVTTCERCDALAKRVEELTKASESLCERVRQTLPGLAVRSNLLASQIEARVEAVERLILDAEDAERRAGRAK